MLEIIEYNKDEYSFPCLVVLGCFDAIHEGHRELFKKAKLQAKINGLDLGVMMFYGGKGGKQVFTFEERIKFLEQYNVKFVLKIDFNDEFKKIKPLDFLANIEDKLNVKAYMSGKDFRFGAGAKGKSATLKKYAEDEENGVWYMSVKDVLQDGEKISTTLIKSCLEQGDVQKANSLLGSKYYVCGTVINGAGRGTSLGFPTVNIAYPENKYEIKHGVYKVETEVDGAVYQGVANYGPRPTFDEEAPVLEVYLKDYNGDLYGKDLIVSFVERLRDVQKFESAEQLSSQLALDVAALGAVEEIAVCDAEEPSNVVEEAAVCQPEATVAPVEETEPALVEEEAPVAEEIETVEEVIEEVAPVTQEVADDVIEEVTPVTEEVVDEVVTEETIEEAIIEEAITEEVVEEIATEAVEEPIEEAPVVEEVIEETTEEITEEVMEDITETVEEAPEASEEIVEEEVIEEVVEKVVEEVAETVDETVEDEINEVEEEPQFVNPDCVGCSSIEYCTCKDKPECECNDVCEDCVCNLCTEEKCSECACDDCAEDTCESCLKDQPYESIEEVVEEASIGEEVVEESTEEVAEEVVEEVETSESEG